MSALIGVFQRTESLPTVKEVEEDYCIFDLGEIGEIMISNIRSQS